MRNRSGFSLVELLVALVLIQAGLLALVGTRALIVRTAEAGRTRGLAVRAAVERLERLTATPCATGTGNVAGPHGTREWWTVTLATNGIREIIDSVTFPVGGISRAIVLRTRTLC